jgi:hypothetical protein
VNFLYDYLNDKHIDENYEEINEEIMKENENVINNSIIFEKDKNTYLPIVSVEVHPLSYYSLPSFSGSSLTLYSSLFQKIPRIPFIFLTASTSGIITIYSSISSSVIPVIQLLVDSCFNNDSSDSQPISQGFLTSCSWCPCNPTV